MLHSNRKLIHESEIKETNILVHTHNISDCKQHQGVQQTYSWSFRRKGEEGYLKI